MFVGAINQDLRSIVAEAAAAWQGLPVYVGCSGQWTIERILLGAGLSKLHSNDVSIYSCAIGCHLARRPFRIEVRHPGLGWMAEYLKPGLPTIAHLLLCTSAMEFWGRDHPYHRRMWEAYVRRWPRLHAETLEKITQALDGVSVEEFYAGDVVDFIKNAPQECVAVTFPPTYAAGYERLYKHLQEAFDWDEPGYELFAEERFVELVEAMIVKRHWLISRDAEIEGLEGYEVAKVQTGMRSKPVWVYSNQDLSRLTLPRQSVENVPYERLEDQPTQPLTIVRLSQAQLNTLRSEYLNPGIAPGMADIAFGILAGGKLIGACAFSAGGFGAWCDLYMMTDLAVHCPAVPRLSKLVLAAVLSEEMKGILEERYARRIGTIGTTAFTTKPASMKYRGCCSLHSRKPGMLNYIGQAGRWSLAGAFEWWKAKTEAA